jgi:hypothetical protein
VADVYEDAFITIAASKAKDPSGGCFSRVHASYRGEVLHKYNNVHIRRVTSSLIADSRPEVPNEEDLWPLL